MSRCVAFLRGMNLGGRRITNERLEELFQGMGFAGATAYQASGNVAFGAEGPPDAALESRISVGLEEELGYPVAVFVRTLDELDGAVRSERIASPGDGVKPHVIFLRNEADGALRERLAALETEDDRFHVEGRQAYWLRRGRLSDSPLFAGALERATGSDTTMRTLGTVARIVKRFGD